MQPSLIKLTELIDDLHDEMHQSNTLVGAGLNEALMMLMEAQIKLEKVYFKNPNQMELDLR